jgi:hypothetical protein
MSQVMPEAMRAASAASPANAKALTAVAVESADEESRPSQ